MFALFTQRRATQYLQHSYQRRLFAGTKDTSTGLQRMVESQWLDPVDVELDEEYDDQWLVKHFAKYSAEHSSQTKGGSGAKAQLPDEKRY